MIDIKREINAVIYKICVSQTCCELFSPQIAIFSMYKIKRINTTINTIIFALAIYFFKTFILQLKVPS